MKKTLLFFLSLSLMQFAIAQSAQDLIFIGDFNFTYSDNVKVQVGAAIANKKKQELHSGSDVGNVKIDPKTYATMEEQAGTSFHFEIKKYGLGNWKEITMKNNKNGQTIKGLYEASTRKFIFASAKGKKQNEKCGSIGLGAVKGQFTADFKKIDGGEFGVGFIAGCNPVLIGASLTFYYSGEKTNETVSINNPDNDGMWAATEDTISIKNLLLNSRWQPVSWAHKGTIVKAKPNDFAGFGENDYYEAVLLNIYDKGSWKYNGAYNTLEINLGKGSVTYFITEINDSSLNCYSFNDEFTLKKKAGKSPAISNSVETKNISKTWKIAYHKKGALKITYKPNDFIRFFDDGTYEHVLLNIYNKGTWSWIEEGKKIKVDCGGQSEWTIVLLNGQVLNLSRPNEVLNLKNN